MSAPTGSSSEPLLDLERLVAGVRRRRRLWGTLALLGLLCGVVLTLLAPPTPSALVRLMVVHENEGSSGDKSLIQTDVALIQTSRIADAALRALDSAAPPERMLESYEAIGLTDNMLELRVGGSSEAQATARAEALAKVFIAAHLRRVRADVDAQTQALRDRVEGIETELAQTTGQTREAALLGRRSDLLREIQRIGMAIPRVESGTAIVDGPRAVTESLLITGLRNVAVGFVLALGAGLGLAAVLTVVQERPVLRREIAAHLGASIIAQLPAPRNPLRSLRRSSRTDAAERERLAATLSRLVSGRRAAVALLELGCADITAALTLDVARRLDTGDGVVVVDDLPERNLRTLAGQQDGQLEIRDGVTPVTSIESQGIDHDLGIGSLRPGTSWTDLPLLGGKALLVVRCGHANAAGLHAVARQLADARITVLGVVLVHPDPRDRSDGTLWGSLHTALREGTSQRVRAAAGRSAEHPTAYLPATGSTGRRSVEAP